MSATDELRRLLDERGVEWDASDTYRLLVTSWKDASGHGWVFMEHRDGSFGKLTAYHLTPEQAIAATLGTGTCRNAAPSYLDFLCSECGFVYYRNDENYIGGGNDWNYCPNCGRRVEVDE